MGNQVKHLLIILISILLLSSPLFGQSNTKQWTKQLGTSTWDEGKDVTTDSSGNIYVTGWTGGGLDGNTNSGNSDIFLVKFYSSGTKQWTKQLGTSSMDFGSGVTTDSSGNIYVTGETFGGGFDGNTNIDLSFFLSFFGIAF